MRFNKIINNILKEEDSSKEDKLAALKTIKRDHTPRLEQWKEEFKRLISLKAPEFPKITGIQLENSNLGAMDIGVKYGKVTFIVFHDYSDVVVYNDEDADIENWEVQAIIADLSEYAKEKYFVFITEDNALDLWRFISDAAWTQIVDRERLGYTVSGTNHTFWEDYKEYIKEEDTSKEDKIAALKSLTKSKRFEWENEDPDSFWESPIQYSNQTVRVRGTDVLIKREYDSDEDSEWYYWSLVDPITKERVFKDIKEDEIKRILHTNFD